MVRKVIIPILILMLASLACSAVLPQFGPTQAPLPTIVVEPTSAIQSGLPQTEADVPRISAEEAKAALDSDAAIIVDVRSADSYAESHIAGSISVPLEDVEQNPAGVYKNKNQWIITYCT